MLETLRSRPFWGTLILCGMAYSGWRYERHITQFLFPSASLQPLPEVAKSDAVLQPAPFSSTESARPRANVRPIPTTDDWTDSAEKFTRPDAFQESESAVAAPLPPQVSSRESNRRIPHASPGTILPAAGEELGPAIPATVSNKTPAGGTVSQNFAAIDQQIAAGELIPAHRELSQLYWKQPELRAELLPRLEKTAEALFFQPQPHVLEPYVIQPGDQLRTIANKHQITWQYLARLNKVDPKRIQAGKRLKVIKGPFTALVELKEFTLTIHLQGHFVKRYSIGIGKDNSSPTGKFTVLNKVENPQYTDPDGKVIDANDPRNPLGERWIDLGNSYGIHGTIDPKSIGKAESRGCIRMKDADIVEVYDFLTLNSEVTLR